VALIWPKSVSCSKQSRAVVVVEIEEFIREVIKGEAHLVKTIGHPKTSFNPQRRAVE
jgi:hypothetical protein